MTDDITIQNPTPQLDPDLLNAAYSPTVNKTVRGGNKLNGVKPELIDHWNNLQNEFSKAGVTPEIKSGYRTVQDQQNLYNNPKTRALTKGNDGVVRISPHQRGEALDISFPAYQKAKGRQIIANYASQNGLHVPSDEPWHISLGKPSPTSNLDPDLLNAGYGDQPSAPPQTAPQLDPDLMSAAYEQPEPQTPKTPQVTSTVREADTGTELPSGPTPQPQPVTPVQFTPTTGASRTTTPTELMTNLLEPPQEGGTAEEKLTKARYKTPPSTELGQAAKIPFSPHLNPTQDDIVTGYLNALGPEYAKYGEKYKQDTGRNILALSPDDTDRDPEGNIYVRPTRAAVDVLNAYVKSGGDINAAKTEGARIAAERRGAVTTAEQQAAPDIAEVQAARTGLGTYSGARRSVESPLISYGGAKLAQLGGLLSGFGIAPTKASDYLQTRGRIMELGAGSAPLTPTGEEVQRSVPEKVATGLTHLGLGVADIVLLKKGTGLSTGQIMALESLAHDTDLPAAQRAQNATQAYAMGRILDGHLNRAMSGAIFGVPTAVESAQQVAKGQKSKTDALIDTLIQGGTGAILGGGKEGDARTAEVQSREALGIERAAKEGLTPEEREAKVQPYFLRDDQGNPVARVLNPDEVAAGTEKMRVRAIHPADTAARDEGGRFAEKPEVLSEPLKEPVSEFAATEAPTEQPTEQPKLPVPQSTPEVQSSAAVSPSQPQTEAVSTQSPDKSAATATLPTDIRSPSDSVVRSAATGTYEGATSTKNEVAAVDSLEGGVRLNDPKERARVDALKQSLQDPNGYFERVVVDGDGNVIEGQHRLEAARELGIRDFILPKAEITRPLAAEGLTSYRYRPDNGSHIAIGAKNDAEALTEAARSLSSGNPDIAKLDVWDGEKYVPATSAEPSEASARPAQEPAKAITPELQKFADQAAAARQTITPEMTSVRRNAIERKASRLEAKARGEQLRHAGADPYELIDDLIIRGGELLDQGRLAFGEWSRKMREEFGKDADPHLKNVWDELKGGQVEEGQITSIKNAAVESRREALELPNLTPADHQSWEEAGIKAREQGLDTPDKADAIAEQVNNGTKRQLTVEESAGLRDRIRGIENDYQALAKQTDGESDPEKLAELKADGDVLREKYRVLTDASKKAGTDIARALAIRRSAVDQDMLLTQLGAEQSYKLTTGKEPTVEVQKQIKDLVDENARLKAKLDEHEEARKLKDQEKDLNKVIVEKKIEIRRAGRKRAHDDLVKERADIKQQIAQAWAKMKPKSTTLSMGGLGDLDPEGELSRALGDLARNYIEDGVVKAADIVDAIHEQIKDVADLTKRQVSDLISGYGKIKESIRDPVERKLNEVKSILASTSGKADVLEQGIRPLRRGQQREKPTEDQRRALRELEDAMRQKGPELARQPYDVRTEQASPLDKAKTTARNRQEQLKKWIADGKREVNGRQQTIPDAELRQLKAENVALERVVARLNDPAADQKAIELRVDALNRQLVKSRADIQSGKTGPQVREGAKSAWSPEIGALMKERDALNRIASDLRATEARKAQAAEKSKPTGIYGVEGSWADFEARAKKALASRARMEKQIAEYQRKIKERDFSTKARPEPVLDREGNAIRAKLEQVKRNFNRLKEKNRDTTVLDALARWKRFAVLTYGTTVGKLTAAASGRMAATPLYESVGQVGKRVMPKTFAEEPSTRGFLKGEVAAVKQLWSGDSLKDFLSHLKGGEDLINLLYGESGGDEFLKSSGGKTFLPRSVGEVMDRPGHLHAALKTVPKRAAFFRYFERALDAEVNKPNPRDIRDPMVQLEIAGEAKAHQEAQRAILQQKNPITEIFNNIIRRTSQSKYRTARLIGKALQFEFPITKVPANYVGEVASHIAGLPAGLGEVAGRTVANRVVRPLLKTEAQTRIGEIRRGLEKRLPQAVSELEPEQRQRIARAIKVGGVGLGFVVWGAMRPDQFGGYYQPGKRDPNDVKFGGMRFMGINIPRWMGHIPPLEAAQFGATIRRVSDSLRAKQSTKTEALAGGVKEAARGLGEEVPFIDTLMNPMHGAGALVGKEGERQKYVGGELRSMIPGAVQQGAKALDYPEGTSFTQRLNPFSAVEPTSRKPESIGQEAEMGIPFLRQTVPISKVFGARPTKASGEVQRLDVSIPGIVKQPDESAREFALRQARVNPYIRKTLEAVVSSPEYDKASDADKTEWLKQAAAGGRRAGEANEPEKPEKPEKKEFPIPEVPRPLSKLNNPFARRFMTRRAQQSV